MDGAVLDVIVGDAVGVSEITTGGELDVVVDTTDSLGAADVGGGGPVLELTACVVV